MASPETPANEFIGIVDSVFADADQSRIFNEVHLSFRGKHIALPGGIVFYDGTSFDRLDTEPWGPFDPNNRVRKIKPQVAAFGSDASGLEIGVSSVNPESIIRVLDHEVGKGTPAAHLGNLVTFRELDPDESTELITWLNSRYKYPDALADFRRLDENEHIKFLKVQDTVEQVNSSVKKAVASARQPRRSVESIAHMTPIHPGGIRRRRFPPKRGPRS